MSRDLGSSVHRFQQYCVSDRVVTYENLHFCNNLPSGPQGPKEQTLVPLELWGRAAQFVESPDFPGKLRRNVVW
jgi:hypothetical protein